MDGEERLALAVGNAVLTPTSSSYHLEKCGGDRRLLVVAGTRQDVGTGRWSRGDLLVLGGANSECYLDTVVGQGA